VALDRRCHAIHHPACCVMRDSGPLSGEPFYRQRHFNGLLLFVGLALVAIGAATALVKSLGVGLVQMAWGALTVAVGWQGLRAHRRGGAGTERDSSQAERQAVSIRIRLIAAWFGLAGIYLLVIAAINFNQGDVGGAIGALVGAGCAFFFPVVVVLKVMRVRGDRQAKP
jgi:hypothetical protein